MPPLAEQQSTQMLGDFSEEEVQSIDWREDQSAPGVMHSRVLPRELIEEMVAAHKQSTGMPWYARLMHRFLD